MKTKYTRWLRGDALRVAVALRGKELFQTGDQVLVRGWPKRPVYVYTVDDDVHLPVNLVTNKKRLPRAELYPTDWDNYTTPERVCAWRRPK